MIFVLFSSTQISLAFVALKAFFFALTSLANIYTRKLVLPAPRNLFDLICLKFDTRVFGLSHTLHFQTS